MQRTARIHPSALPNALEQTLLVGRLPAARRQFSLRQLTLATESTTHVAAFPYSELQHGMHGGEYAAIFLKHGLCGVLSR